MTRSHSWFTSQVPPECEAGCERPAHESLWKIAVDAVYCHLCVECRNAVSEAVLLAPGGIALAASLDAAGLAVEAAARQPVDVEALERLCEKRILARLQYVTAWKAALADRRAAMIRAMTKIREGVQKAAGETT